MKILLSVADMLVLIYRQKYWLEEYIRIGIGWTHIGQTLFFWIAAKVHYSFLIFPIFSMLEALHMQTIHRWCLQYLISKSVHGWTSHSSLHLHEMKTRSKILMQDKLMLWINQCHGKSLFLNTWIKRRPSPNPLLPTPKPKQ